MAHGHLNLGISVADHTPTTTSSLAKGRMAQALCNGLALSLEILILALLLSFRLVELVSTRCLAIIGQSAKQPKSQYSKNPRPQPRREACRLLTENHDLDEPQEPPLKTLVPRAPLVRSSSSVLPEMSTIQHQEPARSRKAAMGHQFPDADSAEEWPNRRTTVDGCLLPVAPSKRSIPYQVDGIPESTNFPRSATIPTRRVSMNQMVHKRPNMLHHDGEANLRESASSRQEGNASNAFSTISISRRAIELQPNVVEPSLLQNPLSPPRPVAHIELPHRRISENHTRDTQYVLRGVEDGSPQLTDSLSYLRSLANVKQGTTGSTSAISKRHQSHRNISSTIT